MNVITSSILGLAILYLVIRHSRFHQAFRWWQGQQLAEDYSASEVLRDQTLQSLFAIRRQIEQLQLGETGDRVLEELYQCQQDLTQLSDRLFSAYGLDSIPLALKDVWTEIALPSSTIAFEVTGELEVQSSTDQSTSAQRLQGQLLLVWLRKILQAGLKLDPIDRVVIDLVPHPPQRLRTAAIEIKIRFCYRDDPMCDRSFAELELRRITQRLTCLTSASCSLKRDEAGLCCFVHWILMDPILSLSKQ